MTLTVGELISGLSRFDVDQEVQIYVDDKDLLLDPSGVEVNDDGAALITADPASGNG